MSYIPETNSVVAFQSNPSSLLAGVSVIGLTPVAPRPGSVFVVNPVSTLSVNPTPASVFVINPVSTLSITTSNSSVNAYQGGPWSIAVLQGTNPWQVNVPTPSYISYQAAGSVMAVSGSFSAGNTSVSAFIESTNTSIFTVVKNSSIAVLQGTNPWVVNVPTPSYIMYQAAGSLLAVSGSFSGGNSSVELLSTSASIATQVNRILTGVSSVQLMAGTNNAGSITAIQGTNPWLIGNNSVLAFQGTTPWTVNSILGTYQEKAAAGNASAIGQVMLFKNNVTTSTLATVSELDPLPIKGSVTVLQGTNPFIINATGSIATVGNSSVVVNNILTGQSSVYLIPGVGVLGSVATLQGTTPWLINVPSPSTIAYQLAGSVMAVNTTVTMGNSSVMLLSTSASIAVQVNRVLTGVGSVMLMASTDTSILTALRYGYVSVMLMASTNHSIVTMQNFGYASVMLMTSTNSSVAVAQSGIWNVGSISGTYAEDSPHVLADRGLFVLGVRNDTMSSITSLDGDYSAMVQGPVGETVIANSPITAWWQADSSIMANISVLSKAAAGTSIFTYVTGVQVTNVSPNNVYITFTGGLGGKTSVLGYSPAPANGGAILTLPNAWKTGANMGVSASVSGMGSIFLSMQGFTAKI